VRPKLRIDLLLLIFLSIAIPKRGLAFCHELEVVQSGLMRVAMVAAPVVIIEWMGHSTFQITSSKGTRILTDPHGAFDLPHPTLPQHIVTTSHQHGPHNSVHMAPGTPVILHGLTPTGEDWQKIQPRFGMFPFTPCRPITTKARACNAARMPFLCFAWMTFASRISAIWAMF
jgi:hypothetical protein